MQEADSTNHPPEYKRPFPRRERAFQRRCSHLENAQTIKITPTMMSNSGKIRRTFSLVCPLWCTPRSVIRTRKGRSPLVGSGPGVYRSSCGVEVLIKGKREQRSIYLRSSPNRIECHLRAGLRGRHQRRYPTRHHHPPQRRERLGEDERGD